jgi:hypothetical protein
MTIVHKTILLRSIGIRTFQKKKTLPTGTTKIAYYTGSNPEADRGTPTLGWVFNEISYATEEAMLADWQQTNESGGSSRVTAHKGDEEIHLPAGSDMERARLAVDMMPKPKAPPGQGFLFYGRVLNSPADETASAVWGEMAQTYSIF